MPLTFQNKPTKRKQLIKDINNTFIGFCQALNMTGIIALFAVSSVIFTALKIDNSHFYGVFALLISWAFIERLIKIIISSKRKWKA